MYVVVVGGGNVGYYLTKELLAAGHEVVVIEEDAARARQIADELGSIVVAALEGAEATNGFVEPPTAEPIRGAPVPGSRADAEAQAAMDAEEELAGEATVLGPGDGREAF